MSDKLKTLRKGKDGEVAEILHQQRGAIEEIINVVERRRMKDLFRAADDLYNAGLGVVNTVWKMGLDKARPQTRRALAPLCQALEDYERARFHRRRIIVEFEAPMPARQLTKRELSQQNKGRKIRGEIRVAESHHVGAVGKTKTQ